MVHTPCVNRQSITANDNVVRIVRTLLAHRGQQQADLATHLGMDSGTMSRALNGKRRWTIEDLVAVAEFFSISPALFFEDSESLISATRTRRDPQEGEISKDITGREITAHFLDDTLFQVAA